MPEQEDTEITKEQYKGFFEAYRKIESEFCQPNWTKEKNKLESFQLRYERHEGQMADILRRDAPKYNIFGILNLGHHEVRLHSPFLTNLLNPKGSHGQGALFLNTFLNDVLKLNLSYADMTNYKIRDEFPFPSMPVANQKLDEKGRFYNSGRIDVLMRFTYQGKRKAIIIENKIYAVDQPEQLIRYENYVLNGLGYAQKDVSLVYLAPRHKPPTPESYDKEKWQKGDNAYKHFSISYHTHIKNWLHGCLTAVKSENLQFILQQYLKTIRKL